MKLKGFCLITISILTFFIITFVDYKNILSSLIDVDNINMDLLVITTNALLVIVLFIITYYYIEKYNENEQKKVLENETKISEIKLIKEKNIEEVIDLFIKRCYKNMSDEIENLNDVNYRETLARKIDFNIPLINDKIYQRIISNIFTHMDTIVEMSLKGNVDKNAFNDLLSAESNFKSYINLRITFFDIENHSTTEIKKMKIIMNDYKTKTIQMINKHMNFPKK